MHYKWSIYYKQINQHQVIDDNDQAVLQINGIIKSSLPFTIERSRVMPRSAMNSPNKHDRRAPHVRDQEDRAEIPELGSVDIETNQSCCVRMN